MTFREEAEAAFVVFGFPVTLTLIMLALAFLPKRFR